MWAVSHPAADAAMPYARPYALGHVQVYGGVQLETLSMEPPIFRVKGFLKPVERAHLVAQAEQLNIGSKMAQSWTSAGIDSQMRTSHTVWLGGHYGVEYDEQPTTPQMRTIVKRAAQALRVDESLVEGIQVTRYHTGSEYRHHTDFRQPDVSARDFNGLNRLCAPILRTQTQRAKAAAPVSARCSGLSPPSRLVPGLARVLYRCASAARRSWCTSTTRGTQWRPRTIESSAAARRTSPSQTRPSPKRTSTRIVPCRGSRSNLRRATRFCEAKDLLSLP